MSQEIQVDTKERISLKRTLRDSALLFTGGVAAIAAGVAVFKYGIDSELCIPAIAATIGLEGLGGGCLVMAVEVPLENHRQKVVQPLAPPLVAA